MMSCIRHMRQNHTCACDVYADMYARGGNDKKSVMEASRAHPPQSNVRYEYKYPYRHLGFSCNQENTILGAYLSSEYTIQMNLRKSCFYI